MTWRTARLEDVAEVRLGRQRAPKNHHGNSMRPYLRAANVTWDGLNLTDVKTMNFTDEEMSTYLLKPGDILLGEASGSASEVGKPALWSGEIEACAFQNTLIRVRPRKHEPRFLVHFFRWQAMAGRFVEQSRGVGIHHLGRARLAAWPIPVPPIGEQRRIVDILEDHLSRLDAAERAVVAAGKRVEALHRAALRSAFEGSGRPQPLPAVATIINGHTPKGIAQVTRSFSGVDCVPFFKVGDMNTADGSRLSESRTYVTAADCERLGLRVAPVGTVVFPKRGGAIATNKKRVLSVPGAYDLNTMGVAPGPSLLSEYLRLWFEQLDLRSIADGSNVPQINTPDVAALRIPVPSIDEQVSVVGRVGNLITATARLPLSSTSARTSQLRQAMLRAAFSGHLTESSSDLDLVAESIG